jgi:hypothetical protein
MNAEERVNQMFIQSGMNKKNWSALVGTHENNIIAIINGRKKATPAILARIADASPEYNRDWVTRGFGPMLTDGTPEPSVANSVTLNDELQDAKNISFTAHLMKQVDRLTEDNSNLIKTVMTLTQQLGKFSVQSEAGYDNVVKFLPEFASVA